VNTRHRLSCSQNIQTATHSSSVADVVGLKNPSSRQSRRGALRTVIWGGGRPKKSTTKGTKSTKPRVGGAYRSSVVATTSSIGRSAMKSVQEVGQVDSQCQVPVPLLCSRSSQDMEPEKRHPYFRISGTRCLVHGRSRLACAVPDRLVMATTVHLRFELY